MISKRYILVLIVITIFSLIGCNNIKQNKNGISNENMSNENKMKQIEKQKAEKIKKQIKEMTLDEKVGQLVMVGVDGYINNDHSKEMIEKYHVGGFILFKQNIKDIPQTFELVNSLKSTNSKNKLPLFLSVDEEGGSVSRVPQEFKKLPSNKIIGQKNNDSLSFNIGSIIGEELKSLGLNMNFAPVIDINSNPNNPVIGDRSFGSTPDIVSKLGIETMKGIQSQNIIPVVKHFPGHGDTSVDSHIGLPIVYNDLNKLQTFEFIPFSNAINNGVDVVMVAHILLPKIDAKNPSSFSKKIITDILRNSLKFKGVVITDDMTMGAIIKNYSIGEAAVQSLNAGTDIILVCHDYDKQIAVINAIKEAMENNVISEDSVDEKVYKILKLKLKYNITDKKVEFVNIDEINNKISNTYK